MRDVIYGWNRNKISTDFTNPFFRSLRNGTNGKAVSDAPRKNWRWKTGENIDLENHINKYHTGKQLLEKVLIVNILKSNFLGKDWSWGERNPRISRKEKERKWWEREARGREEEKRRGGRKREKETIGRG